MSIDYRKRAQARPAPTVTRAGADSRITVRGPEWTALANAHRRYVRAHDALDTAQANNTDSMRKRVPVPWAEFFGAVRDLGRKVAAMLDTAGQVR